MKKSILIVFAATALYAVFANLQVHGLNPSISERSFTNKFGAHGYLLNASNYFRNYRFRSELCKQDENCECKKKCKKKNKEEESSSWW